MRTEMNLSLNTTAVEDQHPEVIAASARPAGIDTENRMVSAIVDEPRGWMTKLEMDQHLQVGLRTVSRLKRRTIIPHTKIRNLVRFDTVRCELAFQQFKVRSTALKMRNSQPHQRICQWRTKRQIAGQCGISVRSMTALMQNRVLPYVKVGNLVRLEAFECDSALDALRDAGIGTKDNQHLPNGKVQPQIGTALCIPTQLKITSSPSGTWPIWLWQQQQWQVSRRHSSSASSRVWLLLSSQPPSYFSRFWLWPTSHVEPQQ